MRKQQRTLIAIVGSLALCAGVAAHVRLIYSGNGQELSWQNPGSISVVLQGMGSADVAGTSDELALRNAIAEWNAVTDSTASLVENTDPAQTARTDWAADDLHLLTFDETNASGYFPSGSGIVAITPLEFFTNGRILDADVIFNGKDFLFTTEGISGRFDIQDVATHELGHLLGLDHSGVAGASMYPYVDPAIVLHRSLSMDDIGGLRDMYPSQTFATITGNLKRASDQSAVAGGYVVCQDGFGRTMGSALADANGSFRIEGLPSGLYDVWADPLDYPVSASNLTPGHTIQTDFESKFLGQVTLGNGATVALGDQLLDADVSVSLGRVADDYPLRVVSGRTVSCIVRGSGLAVGSTLTASDPSLTLGSVVWSGSSVSFQVSVPNNAPNGHVDLLVSTALGDQDLLPGALEITPPDPTVTQTVPSAGPGTGGYAVQITGTNFQSGSRVVIGNQIYADGAPGGCTVVNSTTIQLTLATTVAGPHDVVVIDPSGIEGREIDGFTSEANPAIASVFPTVGASEGGTRVTLRGQNFVPGATVTINGVAQTQVSVPDSSTLLFTTAASVPGGPHVLTVENPGGQQASAAFVYSASMDPKVVGVYPTSGPQGGGTEVQLSGTGFSGQTTVVFGADPFTGLGGTAATQVTVLDDTHILVVTPAASTGWSSVLVEDMVTTQASVLSNGFTYQSESTFSETFSFGGCHGSVPKGGVSWRQMLEGSVWMLLVYGGLVARFWMSRR